ncbi:MAG: pilus assembly protein N-terminal domain-containing protein [Alcaligenaceae bacterium]|nr:pilus assembly protein N-terminal domain-containing protein [Alcaligenaceae bacterium]
MREVGVIRLLAAGLFACAGIAGAQARETGLLALQVGEVKVLAVPDVARVAVGDGQVINAVTTDEKEVIVFARREGATALQIWGLDGQRRRYQVEVAPEGAKQIQRELRGLLERIPGAAVTTLGDKLVVEGDDLSDEDRERVSGLAKRYPQLLDFTGRVGWDRMVLLDVQVVEVPRSQLLELGLRWDTLSEGGLNAGLAWDGGSKRLADRPGSTAVPIAFPATVAAGYFGVNALLSARINALAQTGSAVVLAQPQLLARSGATAEFLAGGEVPYSTVDANGNTNTAFKPYGVSLRITPRVERNGAVRSQIDVEVSSVDNSLALAAGPSLKTRRAATEFNVRSGQTLVLAGFLSRDDSRNFDKIPGLGDIPVLGQLFKSRRFQRNETELAIFVTPVLVDADHPGILRRVENSRSVLAGSFPETPVLNTPLPSAARLPAPVPDPAGGPAPAWQDQGSQWAGEPPPGAAVEHGIRGGANLHDFQESRHDGR